MKTINKSVPELKQGDIVHMHGGTFEVQENAKPCMYDPDVFTAKSICKSGTVTGYFYPGSEWKFQGNMLATKCVEV